MKTVKVARVVFSSHNDLLEFSKPVFCRVIFTRVPVFIFREFFCRLFIEQTMFSLTNKLFVILHIHTVFFLNISNAQKMPPKKHISFQPTYYAVMYSESLSCLLAAGSFESAGSRVAALQYVHYITLQL